MPLVESASQVEEIFRVLPELSPRSVAALYEYTYFVLAKDLKHKAFVEETLAAKEEPALCFTSAEEAFQAIFDEA